MPARLRMIDEEGQVVFAVDLNGSEIGRTRHHDLALALVRRINHPPPLQLQLALPEGCTDASPRRGRARQVG